MLVFKLIASLSLLVLSQSLKPIANIIRAHKSYRNLALFQSQTSLDTFLDPNFDANWRVFKNKFPDLNTLFTQTVDFVNKDYYHTANLDELVSLLDDLCDHDKFNVKLVCGDKSPAPLLAHRLILSTRSQAFDLFFFRNPDNGDFTVIELPDVSTDVCKELLHFMYYYDLSEGKSKVFQKDGMGEGLLRAALKYKITDLITIFDQILTGEVNASNAIALRLLAKKFNLKRLLAACKANIGFDLVRNEFKKYALQGIAGEDDEGAKGQNYEGQSSRPTAALRELGNVDESKQNEEDMMSEVDCDYGSDECGDGWGRSEWLMMAELY